MTLLAVQRYIEGFMIGIGSLVVVSGMTPGTGIRCAGIVTIMA